MTRLSIGGTKTYKRTVIRLVGAPAIIVLGLVLLLAASRFPSFATWYAAHVYPVFPHTIGRFWGLFPFSGFEILVLALAIYIVVDIVRVIVGYIKSRRHSFIYWSETASTSSRIKSMALRLLYSLAALFLMFVLTTGINYNRESFAYHTGITIQDSTIYELEQLYMLLIARAEILSNEIETDEHGRFLLKREGIHEYARQSMHELNSLYGGLGTYFVRAKAPMFSRVLSNMNIGGFFSPWTLEAHFNGDMPGQSIPFVINHELAHAAGHMREDEANFIAYLASNISGNVDFRYSATYIAISYVLNDLRRAVSADRYRELFAKLPAQVQRDFAAAREYWQSFQGRAADISTRTNDLYLRLNQQQDGVLSYGRMVALLLAYYREAGLLDVT
ncbi:MAG: DUF3810 domain-containing protein [Defluviitaleaceae bacterium]|nr:DUF3810 domain-containing protein [Defluviitaleaceae bacterium]